MAERSGPVVRTTSDIRNLPAKFQERGSHWAVIRGNDGYVSAAGNAKVAILNRWVIRHSGQNADGTPRHRFKAQFSWSNEVLLNMAQRGEIKPRIILQMMTAKGRENVDILGWDEWRFEDGVLTLENIYRTEGVRFRPMDGQ